MVPSPLTADVRLLRRDAKVFRQRLRQLSVGVGSDRLSAAWMLCRHSNEILVVAELGKVTLIALVQPGGCTLTVIRSVQVLDTHAPAHHHRHL